MEQNTRRFDACIFDLDGTLANTLTSIAHFGNATLGEFGLPEIPVEQYKQLVGNGADLLMRRMLKTVGARFSEEVIQSFRTAYDRRYESDPMALVEPYPGIVELLGKLKEQGFQVGVLSNKPDNVARDIVRTMFGPLVDQAHGQRAEFPTKPDPAAVLQMAADFGVEPGRVLYCGDSGVDMETGRNAGMAPCGVLWGFRERQELEEHGAQYLAATAQQLWEIGPQHKRDCRQRRGSPFFRSRVDYSPNSPTGRGMSSRGSFSQEKRGSSSSGQAGAGSGSSPPR